MNTLGLGRVAVKREVVALAALFVLGLGLGLGCARLLVGEPRVSTADSALLIAQIYQREHSVPLAIERLQTAGIAEPGKTVAEIAQRYPTSTDDSARDAQSLRELAKALGQDVDGSATAPREAQPIWILTLLVFLFVLGLGSLLVFRILGVSVPSLPRLNLSGIQAVLPSLPSVGPLAKRLASRPTSLGQAAPEAGRPETRPVQPVAQARPHAPASTIAVRPQEPPAKPVRPDGDVAPAPAASPSVRPSRQRPAAARTQYRFRSTYYYGDEPYDEIHPIADPRTQMLVGACGLSAAHQLGGDGTARYWGFTAWVQDYVGKDQQLRAIGLVSRWAYLNCGDEIDEWLRSGQIDEVRQVEGETTVHLETTGLSATVSVEDCEFADGGPSGAYVSRLAAQFDVTLRAAPDGVLAAVG